MHQVVVLLYHLLRDDQWDETSAIDYRFPIKNLAKTLCPQNRKASKSSYKLLAENCLRQLLRGLRRSPLIEVTEKL